MSQKVIGIAFSAFLIVLCFSAEAQQPKKVSRIGYLTSTSARLSVRTEAVRQALRDLGYLEGQNTAMECRYAEGKLDRAPGRGGFTCAAGDEGRVVINLNAAKQIGLTIPPRVLERANQVIR